MKKYICYKTEPINYVDDIPVFSDHDAYIDNYDLISGDHLSYFEKTGTNPFMNESHWLEIEQSTEQLINKYSKSLPLRILDVGVGMGRLLERFPNTERYGVDISLGYLKYAKEKKIEVCMAKIEDMPYKDNYFDIVVCTDVLEHVLDLNNAVNMILKTLKVGGIFIFRVPYKEDLSGYLAKGYPYDLVHLRSFDEYNLIMFYTKIFKCDVLEHQLTGYQGGQIKFVRHLKFLNWISKKFLGIVRRINTPTYKYLCSIVCLPIEINFVVRKSV